MGRWCCLNQNKLNCGVNKNRRLKLLQIVNILRLCQLNTPENCCKSITCEKYVKIIRGRTNNLQVLKPSNSICIGRLRLIPREPREFVVINKKVWRRSRDSWFWPTKCDNRFICYGLAIYVLQFYPWLDGEGFADFDFVVDDIICEHF